MKIELLREADRIFSACGRPVQPQGAGWVDFPYGLQYQKILTAGSPDSTEEKIVATEVPWVLRAFQGFASPQTVDAVWWRLRLPTGRYLQSRLGATTGGFNVGSFRMPVDPPLECVPGSKFFVTVDAAQGVGTGSDVTVGVLLEGTLRYAIKGSICGRPIGRGEPWTLESRYRQDPNQNILAPEWRCGNQCYPETPAGFVDEYFTYATPGALLPSIPIDGTVQSGLSMPIDPSSEFLVTNMRWQLYAAAGITGTLYVNLHTDDGFAVTDGFCRANNIGAVTFPRLPLRAGGALIEDMMFVDSVGAPGSTISVQTILTGVRRRRAG